MKIIYLFTFGFFLLFANFLSAQQLQWAKNMGKTGADEALATAVDATGNVYTTGYFEGTSVNFSPTLLSSAGGRDAFIEKRDTNGNLLWVQRIGSIGQEEGRGIALDNAGNVYVTGVFQATVDFDPSPAVSSLNAPIGAFDAFVMKLTNAGNFVWVKSAGVNATTFFSGTITWTNIYSTGIVVDATGNSFTVGYFENAGYRNVVVMRLSTTGTTGWMRLTTSNALSQGLGIALDASEDIYITGDFQGTIDFGGGNSFSTSGNRNIFLSKLTRGSGTIVWAKNLGGSGNDSGRALKIDSSGNIYLTGAFSSTVDFGGTGNTLASNGIATDLFVGKFDNVGTALWVKSIGGTNTDTGTGLGIVGNNIYLIGTFWLQANVGSASLLSAGRDDMLLTKLDNTGNFVWARRMGGSGADKVNAIALTADENIYLAGSFSASANLDPSGVISPLTVVGGTDAFINKIKEIPDNNSRAVAPLTQVPAQNLALGTLGVELFRFSIADLATSDGFATRVSQVQIQQGTGNTVAGWTGKIIDAKLYIGATEIATTATINATNLTFAISAGSLSIANASNATISLKISLASTGLSNGDKLAFQLPTTGHGFTTHATESSSFAATFPATILSNLMNIDTSLPTPANQSVKLEWVKGAGSTGDDTGRKAAVDSQGNVYTTGWFLNTVDFDPGAGTFNLISAGATDMFIQKLDANGNFIWAKRIGGIGNDAGNRIVVDAQDNMYITGWFSNTADFDPNVGVLNLTSSGVRDIFIQKLDKNGNLIWAKNVAGSSDDAGLSIALDTQGDVYTTGYFAGTADFDPSAGVFNMTSAGGDDIFIQKLDNNGNFVWAKRMGAAGYDNGGYEIVVAQNNIYTTGFFQNTVDFDPNAGVFDLTSLSTDIYVLKLDTNGNFIWAKNMRTGNGFGVVLDNQENIYTVGPFQGTTDFDPNTGVFNLTSASAGVDDGFIQKLDKDGNFVWAKITGGTGIDRTISVAIDAQSNVYSAGYFSGTVDFDPGAGVSNLTSAGSFDIFIQKLDANGNFIFAKRIGGTGNDEVTGITVDGQNNIYLTGPFENTVDFDPSSCLNNLTSAGITDIYTLKFSQVIANTDKDALADLPTTQTAAQSVSMGVQDVEVFKFKIKDLGAFDCLPTIVRQIRLQQGTGNTVANWTGKITGAKIFIGTTELSSTLTIGATSLNFALSGSTLTVPNGTNQEITVKISLASSGFVNGDKLAFQIPTVSHLLTADASGSPFATVFPSIVLSNLLTIDASLPVPLPTVQDLKLEWVKKAGNTGDDRGRKAVIDTQGNIYTTGWFQGTVDFDPSASVFNLTSAAANDMFVQKLDKDGNFVWAKRMGGIDDAGNRIAIDTQENVYIIGWFSGTADFDPNAGVFNLTSSGARDIFIQKLDKDGNFVWAKNVAGSLDDAGLSIALDTQGNVYTSGYFSGTADFDPGAGVFNLTSAGGNDICIQKLDTNGNFVWAKRMGAAGYDNGSFEFIVSASNNIYCTGHFQNTVDFDPNAGIFNLTFVGGDDIVVQKLDTDGNFIWAKSVGGALSDIGISTTVDSQENVYTCGIFQGTADFDPGVGVFNLTSSGGYDAFIQKLDKDGNFIWAKSFGSSGSDRYVSVVIDTQSNVCTTGWFEGTVDFDPNAGVFNLTSAGLQDIFIQKLDANGNFIFAKGMGGTGNEEGIGITFGGQNNIYLTGSFESTVDFDPSSCTNSLTSAGGADVYTLKMRQVSANTDKDALAVVPTVQLAGTLLPVGVVDESVFKFKLQDLGVYDCTPTLLRQIRIQQGAGNTVANWAGKIVAAKLFVGASQVVGTVAINATDIVFTITGTNLQLLNSEEKEITLKISLASAGFVDGDKFAFQIPAVSSGLVSDASGSQFATTLPTDLLSGIFTITISKPLDENSVAAPTTQVPAQDASMCAVDLPVFKFTLQDEGTVDGLPTVVSQVFIQQGAGNTVADWTGKIIGAKLFNAATEVVGTVTISESAITFSGLSLSIANGGSVELTLKVSLAATGFTNGDKFAFQIPSVSHNLQASSNNSSQFANSLPNKVASEILTIVVLSDLIVTTAETNQGNYNNVTIKSTGELTLSGNMSSAGVFKIETGGKLLVGNCFIVTGAGSFVMEANTTLQVCSLDGITLTGATGNIQLTGTRTYSEASYIYNGTVPQLTGNGLPATILNLTLNNASGATLTNNVGVKYLVDLQNGDLTSNGKLTLLSTATQTGMIVQKVDGTNSVIGNATIQRHVIGGQAVYPAAYNGIGYHCFSSPLQNGTVAEFADNMPLVLNPSYDFVVPYSGAFPNFYLYRENRLLPNAGNDVFEKGWESPANTSQSLVPQRGYIVNVSAGTLIDFTGLLNNGTLNTTLSRGIFPNSGWQFMGNPYPAPISWTAVANKNTNIHGQVLRRIPTGQYAGTWASYINGVGQNGTTDEIALAQGFFVRANIDNAAFQMDNSVRLDSYTNPTFFRTEDASNTQKDGLIRLQLSQGKNADETAIYFEQGATENFDYRYDADRVQYNSSPIPSLFTVSQDNKLLAINGLPVFKDNYHIPLTMYAHTTGRHSLKLQELAYFKQYLQVYLEDKLLDTFHNLTLNPDYVFNISSVGFVKDRFVLRFTDQVGKDGALDYLLVYPNPSSGDVNLQLYNDYKGEVSVKVYDVTGRIYKTEFIQKDKNRFETKLNWGDLPQGMYLIELTDNLGTKIRKWNKL